MMIGYVRVSTSSQDTALQVDALRQAGAERIFEETASGTRSDRPAFAAALDSARAGDTLIVWRLDRLARSLRQLLTTVDDLQARGIGLRSLTEAIDTGSPSGRLILHIFGCLNQFEVELVRQRTRAGLDASRARGRVGGRPRALTEQEVRAARAMLSDVNFTVADVARQLGVAPSTLYRSLPGGRSALSA